MKKIIVVLLALCSAVAIQAATVAYWQFDADGTTPILGDAVGGYGLSQAGGGAVGASGLLALDPITNPDTSAGFAGGASAAADNVNSAFLNAGVATYMYNTGGDAMLNLNANSWTIEGWFRLDAAPGGVDTLFNTRNDATGVGILMDLRNGITSGALANLYVKDSAGVANWNVFADSEIAIGDWYHYALTYTGGTFEFFLDGTSKGTLGTAGMNLSALDSNDGGYLQIMGRTASPTSSLGGRIDEWRISDQVLGSSQFLNYGDVSSLGVELLSDPFNDILRVKASPDTPGFDQLKATVETNGTPLVVDQALTNAGSSYATDVSLDLYDIASDPAVSNLQVTVTAYDEFAAPITNETQSLDIFPEPAWLASPEGLESGVPLPWFDSMKLDGTDWLAHDSTVFPQSGMPANTDPANAARDLGSPMFTPTGELFRVWGRDYDFGNVPGILLQQVGSLGTNLLESPVSLSASWAGGGSVSWTSVSNSIDHLEEEVVRTQSLASGDLSVEVTTRLGYDGFVWFDLVFSASSSVSLDELLIEIPVHTNVAERYAYYYHNAFPYRTGHGEIAPGSVTNLPFCRELNLVNDQTGIGWCGQSAEGWMPTDPDYPLTLQRSGSSVVLEMHVADQTVVIDEPWVVSFGVQAYPVKPWDWDAFEFKSYEPISWNWLNTGGSFPENFPQNLDYLQSNGVKVVSFHEHWAQYMDSGIPQDAAGLTQLVDAVHARGMKMILYTGFGHCDKTPWFNFYRWPWLGETLPGSYYEPPWATDGQRSYTTFKEPEAHWNDFMIGEVARWIDEYDVDGVYVDSMFGADYCDRAEYGHGYTNNGTWQGEFLPVEARDYAERMYKAVRSRKPDGIVDVHRHMFYPYSGAYATHDSAGETHAYVMSLEGQENMDESYIRAVLGKQHGVPGDNMSFAYVNHGVYSHKGIANIGWLSGGTGRAAGGLGFLDANQPYWGVSDFIAGAEYLPWWNPEEQPVLVAVDNWSSNLVMGCFSKAGQLMVALADVKKGGSDPFPIVLQSRGGTAYNWVDADSGLVLANAAAELTLNLIGGDVSLLMLEPVGTAPIAYWEFDNDADGLYSDASSNSIDLTVSLDGDSSPYAGSGLFAADPVPNPDPVAGATNSGSLFHNDTTGLDYLYTTASDPFDLNGEVWTLEGWLRHGGSPIRDCIAATRQRSGGGWELFVDSASKLHVYMDDDTGAAGDHVVDYAAGTVLATDQWYHFAMTWNSTGGLNSAGFFELFLDGVSDGSADMDTEAADFDQAQADANDSGKLMVAGRGIGSNNEFNGRLDELRFSGGVLPTSSFLNQQMYMLTLVAGSNGAVSPGSGSYPAGGVVPVSAFPDIYYHFDVWSGDTNAITTGTATDAGIFVTMNAPVALDAAFAADTTSGGTPHGWLANANPAWTNDFEAASTNDHDLDQLITGDEYICGTDPTNGASGFFCTIAAEGDAVVQVETVLSDIVGQNRRYGLESSTNLNSSWSWVPGYSNILGLGQTILYTNSIPESACFFRGKVWFD